jgi:hypothetical protein
LPRACRSCCALLSGRKAGLWPNGPHPEIHESIRYFEETTNAELDEAAETKDAEATIARLAKLNDVAYARQKKHAATDLKIPVGRAIVASASLVSAASSSSALVVSSKYLIDS